MSEHKDCGDALMDAWGLIANAWQGNWDAAPQEWQDAAIRYRDETWHPWLDQHGVGERSEA